MTLPGGLAYQNLQMEDEAGRSLDPAILRGKAEPGYYRLGFSGHWLTLAVAPTRCRTITKRCWGVTIQIPSLVGKGQAFGDFALLADAVKRLAAAGADAVALSPVHAQSLDCPERFTPYSPSSRIELNSLLGAVKDPDGGISGDLIDWTIAGPAKLDALRNLYARSQIAKSYSIAEFLQNHASQGFQAVQTASRVAGMEIGLITDLAVGVDPEGEEAKGQPDMFLQGLSIGAPPDPLGPMGQDWGLTSYSPHGMADTGFAGFIAMLRANLASAGGIRIDHAFGLQRLWVVPKGRPASEGAYLTYPFQDLLRLIKLEASRADAIVIAEDLGTRPPGFSEAIATAGIYGMAVLPFMKDGESFIPATSYQPTSIVMSGTHDTPTLAGWWTARDLEWNRKLKRDGPSAEERSVARRALWKAIGCGASQPEETDPAPVIDRALAFLAATPAPLLLVPIEDLIGLTEQPNLPGTTSEHPNWRRRLPASIAALLERTEVAQRVARLTEERP